MHGNQLTHAGSRRSPCIRCRLHRANVPADHHGHKAAAHMYFADQLDVGRLDHRIRRFHRTYQSLGLDHTQCL